MKAIADTGLLVAFANRNDRHHAWVVGIAQQISAPLMTCEVYRRNRREVIPIISPP